MSEQLALVPVNAIKEIVDLLDRLGIDPLHLHIDGSKPTERRPDIRLWCRYRTDFERVCASLALKPKEARFNPEGQRSWHAEQDTDDHRLFVACVSFKHHDDWVQREAS
ncbi:MAG TPA: hypothetical protein VFJ19_09675 [Nocardioidaceae bacterium]|nr:hypothetical protein [Nocardioidaceae bacterium]